MSGKAYAHLLRSFLESSFTVDSQQLAPPPKKDFYNHNLRGNLSRSFFLRQHSTPVLTELPTYSVSPTES